MRADSGWATRSVNDDDPFFLGNVLAPQHLLTIDEEDEAQDRLLSLASTPIIASNEDQAR